MSTKTQIERIATNSIRTYVDGSNHLRSYIDDNDKTPIWDGSIFVYKDDPDKNENLIGEVKTQIKGRSVSEFRNEEKYSIPLYSIKNYMRGGGVVFFLVEVIKELNWKQKIFYALLPPIELKSLLQRNSGKNNITITLSPLPSEIYILENELHDFLINSVKQQSYINTPTLKLKDLVRHDERVVLETEFVTTNDCENVWASITERPIYLYKKIENATIPIEDTAIYTQVKELMQYPVSINGKKYFDQYVRVINYNQVEFHIGDFLVVANPRERFKDETMASSKFDVKYNTLISECQNKLEFIIEMLSSRSITLGNETIPFTSNRGEEERVLLQFSEEFNFLQEIKETWKEFNIPYELDFGDLDEEGRVQLGNLVYYVHRHNLGTPKDFESIDNVKYSLISFGKTKVLVLFKREMDNKFYSYNAFDPCQKMIGLIEKGGVNVPLLTAILRLNKEYIVDNVDYDYMKKIYRHCLQLDVRFTEYIKNDISILSNIACRETIKEKKIIIADFIEYLKLLLAE